MVPAPAGDPLQLTSAKTLIDVQNGLKFAKSPRWIGQKLLFLDIHDRAIKSAGLNGTVRTVRTLPYVPSGFAVPAPESLLVGDAQRRRLYLLEKDSQEQAADLSDVARTCLSDAIVAAHGGIYVSDVGFNFLDPFTDPMPNGIIVHINNRGRISLVAKDIFFPSGMIITPDNRTLIVAETLGHRLTAFDIAKDGSLGGRRVWAPLPDDVNPDGICLDSEGAIWAAATTAP